MKHMAIFSLQMGLSQSNNQSDQLIDKFYCLIYSTFAEVGRKGYAGAAQKFTKVSLPAASAALNVSQWTFMREMAVLDFN